MPRDPHDELLHIIIELFESTSQKISGSPLPKHGELLYEFDYRFDFKVFKEGFDEIFRTDNVSVPDGVIRNASLGIDIVCECKTGISDETRFSKQLKFFSEAQYFKQVFQIAEQNEILVVCLLEIAAQTVNLIKKMNLSTNIVVWSVDMEPNVSEFPSQVSPDKDDRYFVKKIYRNHLDKRLDKKLEIGIPVPPPTSHFLTNENTPMPQLVEEMTRRILSNSASANELDVNDFITSQTDSFIEDKKMLEAINNVFTLMPKLGHISADKKTINLKRLNHRQINEILSRTEEIKKWDTNKLNEELKNLKKSTKQATMLDFHDES